MLVSTEQQESESATHIHVCTLSFFSRVQLFANLWAVARQAPLSMEFSRQEYWSGLPCPPPGELLDPEIEPESLRSPALANGFFTTSTTWEAHTYTYVPSFGDFRPIYVSTVQ